MPAALIAESLTMSFTEPFTEAESEVPAAVRERVAQLVKSEIPLAASPSTVVTPPRWRRIWMCPFASRATS